MHQRIVGNSGLRVSSIGLGCNNFGLTIDAAASKQIIHRALDLGVTLFDTAPVYGEQWGASERILGDALGARRKDVVIVSKFGMNADFSLGPNTSRRKILTDVEESLQRLGTDYIDLYLLHWPDAKTPMQETLRALDDIIKSGKARYIGCCNLPAWKIVDAKWISKTEQLHEYIVSQDEYSLANRAAEKHLLPALDHSGMSLMPYSPLANGLLTGRYSSNAKVPEDSRLGKNLWNLGNRFLTPQKLKLADDLNSFSQQFGHTLLELAVSWLLANSRVCSVIAGVTKLEQLEKNIAAGEWQLNAGELKQVDAICSAVG